MPVYNGGALFRLAVDSLLGQHLGDFELILADNGSEDDTLEWCHRFAAEDPRVRVLSSPANRGAAWNFIRCVATARAPLFKWAAHDDLYDERFLLLCVDVLDGCPDVAVAFTRTVEIDEHGDELLRHGPLNVAGSASAADRFRAVLFDEVYCYAIFGVVRTDTLRRRALIQRYSASDRVLLAELALHGRFVELREPCFLHREHEGRSMRAYTDGRQRMLWFDPNARADSAMTLWHQALGYAQALRRGGPVLEPDQRRRAWQALGHWTGRHAAPMTRQVATRARAALLRRPAATSDRAARPATDGFPER